MRRSPFLVVVACAAVLLTGCTPHAEAKKVVGYQIASQSGMVSLTGTKCSGLDGDWQLTVASDPGAPDFTGTMVAQFKPKDLHGTFFYNVVSDGAAVKGVGNAELHVSGGGGSLVLTAADPKSPLTGSFEIRRDSGACR